MPTTRRYAAVTVLALATSLCAGPGVALAQPENHAPVAVDDSYQAREAERLVIAAPGVLGNDTDPDGDALTAAADPDLLPEHGLLTINPDGSIDYLPDVNFFGPDTFGYLVLDGSQASDKGTVTVVMAPNADPVAIDDSYTTEQDTELVVDAPGMLANDTDPDDSTLSAFPGKTTPEHGTMTLNRDGSFSYHPAEGFVGEDSFSYIAFDGRDGDDEATVTIAVTATATSTTQSSETTTTESSSTETSSSNTTTTVVPPTTTAPAPGGGLATTGGAFGTWFGLGTLLLLLGASFVAVARRRRTGTAR
jgi:VCBS repeat-containing protein